MLGDVTIAQEPRGWYLLVEGHRAIPYQYGPYPTARDAAEAWVRLEAGLRAEASVDARR